MHKVRSHATTVFVIVSHLRLEHLQFGVIITTWALLYASQIMDSPHEQLLLYNLEVKILPARGERILSRSVE